MLSAIAQDNRLTRAEVRCLLLALRHETEPGAEIELSARFVAEGIKTTKRTAEAVLPRLVRIGYLVRVGKGRCGANTYQLAIPTEADFGPKDTSVPKQSRTLLPKQSRTKRRPPKTTIEKTAKEIAELYISSTGSKEDSASRQDAAKHIVSLLSKTEEAGLRLCVDRYAQELMAKPERERFPYRARNFFGKAAYWEAYASDDWQPPADPATDYDLTPEQVNDLQALEDELQENACA